jgi:hypothetical protein
VITVEELRRLFDYDPLTGVLTRKRTGKPCGSLDSGGYLQAKAKGKLMQVHRIGYLMYHGEVPKEIDHHNRKRDDNRVSNLRPATRKQNNGNRSKNRNNTSGYKGVTRNAKSGWRAQITINGAVTYLGSFSSPEAAYECYKVAAISHFGEAYAAL